MHNMESNCYSYIYGFILCFLTFSEYNCININILAWAHVGLGTQGLPVSQNTNEDPEEQKI